MKRNDEDSRRAAGEIAELTDKGEKIVHIAAVAASDQMARLVLKMDTKERRIEALKYHALSMGIGTEFLEVVVPQATKMVEELKSSHKRRGGQVSDEEASILTALWLAKIFMEIHREVSEHEQE